VAHEHIDRTLKHNDIFGTIHIKNELETEKDKKNLKGKFCPLPFEGVEIDPQGRVYTCCVAHMPYAIGNVYEEKLEDIWHGEKVKLIRESILDGSYKYCMHTICPRIVHEDLREITEADKLAAVDVPIHATLNLDATCNLYCPSCRKSKVDNNDNDEEQKKIKAALDDVVSYIFSQPSDKRISLNVTGAGDPFYSIVYRDFLFNFDPRPWPNLKLNLVTHGVMLTKKYWDKMSNWHTRLKSIQITVDAASEDTYNKLRPGGNWNLLVENIKMLGEQLINYPETRLELYYIVQKGNYKEMIDFIELVNKLVLKGNVVLVFNKIMDWGTYSYDQYKDHAVWRPDHSEYQDYLSIIDSIRNKQQADPQWGQYIGMSNGDIF
jgi:radical SAM protein with 4Fe4S-binding SPASM domain